MVRIKVLLNKNNGKKEKEKKRSSLARERKKKGGRQASRWPNALEFIVHTWRGIIVYVVCRLYSVGRWIERWRECKTWEITECFRIQGFKISHTRTKYINCNFSRDMQRIETTIRIEVKDIRFIQIPCFDN